MPDAKFESNSFSIFRDMTSQNQQVIELGYSPQGNGFYLKKMNFCVQNRSPRPKLTPTSISAIFNQLKIFHF